MGCACGAAFATACLPFLIVHLTDAIAGAESVANTGLLALAVLVGFIARGAGIYGQAVLVNDAARKMVGVARQGCVDRLFRTVPAAPSQKSTPDDLAASLARDSALMHSLLVGVASGVGLHGLSVLILFGVMLALDWTLAVWLVALAVAGVFALLWLFRMVRRAARDAEIARAGFEDHLACVARGLREVKAYGADAQETEIAADLIGRASRLNQRTVHLRGLLQPAAETLAGLTMIVLLILAGLHSAAEDRTPGQIVGFLTALLLAWPSVRRLADLGAFVPDGLAAVRRLHDTLNRPALADDTAPALSTWDRISGEIRLSDVSVDAAGSQSALPDITLFVPAGSTMALVGSPDSGAATIIDLILRFCEPTAGSVLLDGQDVRTVTANSLYRQVALLIEAPILMNDTVRANIAYGVSGADERAVQRAAEAAGADAFIAGIPRGYDTLLGGYGAPLSKGAHRAVGIARAFLKDPPILLVDLVGASRGGDGAAAALSWPEALNRLSAGRTTLIRADRVLGLPPVDRIAIIDQGRVAEIGTHSQLIAEDGLYAQLWRLETIRAEPHP